MNTRKERLDEVYEYLRANYGIHSKTDFALALGVRRPGVYSAMNGDDRYLTDSFFKKICATWQGVFNLQYLLSGEGFLLESTTSEQPARVGIDGSSLINAALAAKDETIAALMRELKGKDEFIAVLRQQVEGKDQLIASLTAQKNKNQPTYPMAVAEPTNTI